MTAAVASDPEVKAFVERLESAMDEVDLTEEEERIPSADTIARDFQRFLRQRGPDADEIGARARTSVGQGFPVSPVEGTREPMYIGTSIFLIALGAILKFAVTATVAGIDIQTAGVILMVVGLIGLVLSLLEMMVWSDRRRRAGDAAVVEERRYRDPAA